MGNTYSPQEKADLEWSAFLWWRIRESNSGMLAHPHWGYIYNPSKPPFDKGGFGGHEFASNIA